MKYGLFCEQVSSPPKSCSFNTRQSGDLCVVSSFALCAVLLRLREFPANGFGRSKNIIPVVYAVNKDALDCEIPHSLGRKCPLEETSKCQCRIAVLHKEILELERNNSYLNSFVPLYPLLTASPVTPK